MLQQDTIIFERMQKLYLLNSEQIDFYWVSIVELFNSVPEFWDYYTPEWTYEQVKTGCFQVWALSDGVIRGIVLTRILVFPRRNVFEIMALAGDDSLDFFETMADVFIHFAQQQECATISALCRPALKKLLRKFGATTEMVVLRKDVPPITEAQ